MKQLDKREIRLVAMSASRLPSVSPEIVDRLIDDLTAELDSPEQLVGSPDDAHKLISGAVNDEQASEIMSEVKGTSSDRVWAKLGDVPDDKLAACLSMERPQIAAVIISRLETTKASAVMELLSRDQRADLSRRMLQLRPVGESAMRLIADRLSQELFGAGNEAQETDRHARLAAILNKLERIQIVEVLQGLDIAVPEDARRVRQHVFCFEDIELMTPEDRATLFDAVPSERTVMAMRGVTQVLGDLIMQSMSPRARRIAEAELSNPVKVPRKSIVQAQLAIAELAQTMAAKSLIRLRTESGPA